MDLENKKDISNVLLMAKPEYSQVVLDAVSCILSNSDAINKMNLREWRKISKDEIDVGVEATYDEKRKESLVTVRCIKTTNKRNAEYTNVKEICCAVKDGNITILDRADYVNRVESLPQAKGRFCEVEYSKKDLLKSVQVDDIDIKKLKSYAYNKAKEEVGKPKPIEQNKKYPIKGLKTREVPVRVSMSVYAEGKNKSVVVDLVNKLFCEKTVLSKQGKRVNIDKIFVRGIPGITSIKKVEAMYDKKKDKCFVKVMDKEDNHREVYYSIDKKGIVHLGQRDYYEETARIREKNIICNEYIAKYSIDAYKINSKLKVVSVKSIEKDNNIKAKFRKIYDNINRLTVKFLKNKIYKILKSINIFKHKNEMKKIVVVRKENNFLQNNINMSNKQITATNEEKKLLEKSANAIKDRRSRDRSL